MTQKTTRTVYKVVRRETHNGRVRYTSALARGKAEVCYKVGQYVEAPAWLANQGYYLLVFGKLDDAKIYYKALKENKHYLLASFEIWEAQAQGIVDPGQTLGGNFDKLERGILIPDGYLLRNVGALFAKRVKLVKRVHPRP
jgi:hypothetical protein